MVSKQPGPVPGHPQKHDVAWKHVQILSLTGDKRQLQCIYCEKIFRGGGIHRIKEHLSCQKGNASRCPRVPQEVQESMQESLYGPSAKRRKKVIAGDEVENHSIIPISMADALGNQGEADAGLQVLLDGIEPNPAVTMKKEETVSKPTEKRKRGRPRIVSPPPSQTNLPTVTSESLATAELPVRKAKDQLQKDQGQAHRDQAQLAIGRFLFHTGIPLDAVSSVYFQQMIDAVAAAGPGLKAPTYPDLRTTLLKNLVEEINSMLEHYKVSWGRTGCTIISDEWMTSSGVMLINFFVSCPEGTLFLKSVDVSNFITSADAMYDLLKQVVEEVGLHNVVQVITRNNDVYMAAGKRLTETYPTLFWSPCMTECISLILEDIIKIEWISSTIDLAQTITKFIYNHAEVLNLLRKYTAGKELLQPTETRPGTSFATLHSMVSLKDNLREVFASTEWMESEYAKLPGGVGASELVGSETFWSSCATIVRLTDPLIRILNIVHNEKRPAMGYVYEGMYRVKEAIKTELKEKKEYMRYWDIIDARCDTQVSRPLHAAGFFLNPQFLYSIEGDVHNDIMSGMLDCVERLVPDTNVQDKINKELSSYKSAAGDFGRKIASRARHALPPAAWWSMYGGSCPNLTRLAIHILSQTCKASGFEHDRIPFEKLHSQIKNRLEHGRLHDLVSVQCNLRLRERQQNKSAPDPLAFENIGILEGWVMEEEYFGADRDLGWKVLTPPGETSLHLLYPDEAYVNSAAGYDDDEIHSGVKDQESIEENGE